MGAIVNASGIEPANIVRVNVWPEAVPGFFDYIYDINGQTIAERKSERVLIIDIGGTTTDVTELYAGQDPITVVNRESIDRGVFDIMHELRKIKEHRSFDPYLLEKIMRADPELTHRASRETYTPIF